MTATSAIGVDWGTTTFRAFRFGEDDSALEIRRAEAGIRAIDDADFEGALEHLVGDWLDMADNVPVVLSGMIGSRQGWIEAPYLSCPADLGDLAGGLVPLDLARGRRIYVVPGLSYRDAGGVPDVMRGEEVQILGAIERLDTEVATLCLPGTHSKWAWVEGRHVTGFATHMTGEVFDVLRRHSILGTMIEHAAWDQDAFQRGVARAAQTDAGGLLHQLFGVRAAGLFGELSPETSGAFLSGLVIGYELRAALASHPGGPVRLIGDEGLVPLYRQALAGFGIEAVDGPMDAAARGLAVLASRVDQRTAA